MLFGPPRTRKSSLIEAMANYLNFDIYDLRLMNLIGNSQLRQLLISTANRSIHVVEDIDCFLELQDRRAQQPRMMNPDLARMMNIDPYPTTQELFFFLCFQSIYYIKKNFNPQNFICSLYSLILILLPVVYFIFSSVFCRISFFDSFIHLG